MVDKAINPGSLTERLLFRYSESSYDPDTGTNVTTWYTRATVWASVRMMSGDEKAYYGLQDIPYRDYEFFIRARDDIKTSDTLVWRGQAHNVVAIWKESERDRYMKVEAAFGAGDSDAVP